MTTELVGRFVRPIPVGDEYQRRLAIELSLIEMHKLTPMFCQVQDIIQLIPDIPHNIRGSAGSSLVCYLLGISHIDPIKWGLGLTRFLHALRAKMPDIDIDVPWNRRQEVWGRVFCTFGKNAARVSNRVRYRTRSAMAEAKRKLGPEADSAQLEAYAEGLMGMQRGWSLHCGGVVIRDKPIEVSELLGPYQLAADKYDVEAKGMYKIDILSSRAMGQLADLSDRPLFDYPINDSMSAELWLRGDGIGVTGGESPAFRKAAMGLAATSLEDVIMASSLIRPAAASGVKAVPFFDAWRSDKSQLALVWDDDVITAISKRLGVSEEQADLMRRKIQKREMPVPQGLEDVASFSRYSFCKSHAVAYGAVVWALSYHKARDPQAFWKSALNNCRSMYRKWVHTREAVRAGIDLQRQQSLFPSTPAEEMASTGRWLSPEPMPGLTDVQQGDRVKCRGLIATYRVYVPSMNKDKSAITFVTLWTGNRYRQVVIRGKDHSLKAFHALEVEGKERFVQRADHLDAVTYRAVSLRDLARMG